MVTSELHSNCSYLPLHLTDWRHMHCTYAHNETCTHFPNIANDNGKAGRMTGSANCLKLFQNVGNSSSDP